jgi:anionic cell wall polymer biosynthesis LytR-Cps2A-Psr (LCP) family protein
VTRRAWVLGFLGVMVTSVLAVAVLLTNHYDGNVERFGDPFAPLEAADRPAKAVTAAKSMTFLVLGSDSRISAGDPAAWRAGAQRTDAIMLMHVPADRRQVQLVSIPRDSWVDIPGHGQNKINAAFSFGGPSLMVATVEQLTNVRIDHVAIADFTGFTALTDSLGGVQLGRQAMDGRQALAYVRQRHGLPGGDLARVQRQQAWMKAVAGKLLGTTSLTNPIALNRRLNDVTSLLAVDDQLSGAKMRSLALSLRKLSGSDIRTMTAPVSGSGREGAQSVLYLAADQAEALWREMRTT